MKRPAAAPATREEIAILARLAGLTLSADYFEELVESYHHVEVMVARLAHYRSSNEEPACIFVPGAVSVREPR